MNYLNQVCVRSFHPRLILLKTLERLNSLR